MNLQKFADGNLIRFMQNGIEEILENISNEETPAAAKRKLTVTITFKPDTDRKNIKIQIETKIDKAPIKSAEVNMFIGIDVTGKPTFYTANEQIPGQMCVENMNEEGG